jgi:hypothetical protein
MMNCLASKQIFLGALFFPLLLSAEIVLVEPAENKQVPLVPQNQKDLIAMPSHAARREKLTADRNQGKHYGFFARTNIWRKALPVTFQWKCTGQETGPFTVMLSETPDFRNPKLLFSSKQTRITPPNFLLNLKLGQKYYWKVAAQGRKIYSRVSSFTTEDHPPRWIAVEGQVANIRDLGGWKTTDGFTVRQGHLFRGQGLNYNSVDRVTRGRNRLMVEDIALLCGELGIRTDLDLRGKAETADLAESPLGKGVQLIQLPSSSYTGIHSKEGKKKMIRHFKVLADPKNHPVYFHCIGGFDRTGAVAVVANGVLGVSENDLASDWEQSSLPNLPDLPPASKVRNYEGMVKRFYDYGKPGDPLKVCIEKYLLSGGVTAEEIETFRKTMLVK